MLTVPQAATLLGISDKLLRRLIAAGRIEHYRVGMGRGKVLLKEDDVQAYLESCKAYPPRNVEARKPRRFRSRFFD